MAEISINIKVSIDEEKKDEYLSNLIDQIKSGDIDEDEAVALIHVDCREFINLEVIK